MGGNPGIQPDRANSQEVKEVRKPRFKRQKAVIKVTCSQGQSHQGMSERLEGSRDQDVLLVRVALCEDAHV